MSRRRSLARAALLLASLGIWGALSCSGGSPVAVPTPFPLPPTTTLPPTTLGDLTATVTSPESGHTFGCRDDVHFKLTVTNTGPTPVTVTGIKKHNSVVHGGCDSAPDFTYEVSVVAAADSTTTIDDRAVYDSGSGCCEGSPTCDDICTFKETFAAVTSLGDVPAGSFQYQVIFGDCGQCPAASVTGHAACRPRR